MVAVARKEHVQVIHEISVAITPATWAAMLAGVPLGVIPNGGMVNQYHLAVITPFNSTTNFVNIGSSQLGSQIASGLDLKTAARTDAVVVSGLAGPVGADFPIYLSVGATGALPTAGLALLWIDYVPGVG